MVVVGDFNSVTSAKETTKPENLDQRRSSGFVSWISEHGLLDLGYTGSKFTWTRGNSSSSFQGPLLDRALCNLDCSACFSQAKVNILPKLNSDHSPVLILLNSNKEPSSHHGFKFQATWLTHPGFLTRIQEFWWSDLSLTENNNLQLLRIYLPRINLYPSHEFGMFRAFFVNFKN